MLFIILCRIFYLQFFQHDELLEKAKQNWDREIPFMAERGEIVDRNGEKLVTNELAPHICNEDIKEKIITTAKDRGVNLVRGGSPCQGFS